MKSITLILILFFSYGISFAQRSKIITTSGTAQIKLEQNMSKEEVFIKVEQLAIIDAITNAFGTYVEQEANITVESGKSRFDIIGTTKVKGEWVETLDLKMNEGFREIKSERGNQQELWITCIIKGKAKEATQKANIEVYTLSYSNVASKSTVFKSGDNMYLYFKSPVDGYLSIYLDDGKNIFKILPYQDMDSESCLKVSADKEYIFFSKINEHNYFRNSIDELEVFTPLKSELNKLHILFSEKKYFKPRLTDARELEGGYVLPKSSSRQQTIKWLAETKATIDDFIDHQIYITILGEY
jgi:hypothetical protein